MIIYHESDRNWNCLQHVCCSTSWNNLTNAEKRCLYFAINLKNQATMWDRNKNIKKFKKSNLEVFRILNSWQQKTVATWLDCLHIFKHSNQKRADENSSWWFVCKSFWNWKNYKFFVKKILLTETFQKCEELYEDL